MIYSELSKDLFYAGVNDRQKTLFENLWPIPDGVAYNSYLLRDRCNTLIDTVELAFSEQLIRTVSDILDGEPLHYLIVNHVEPDHSGSIAAIRRTWPDVKIVGNARTFDMLRGYYGIADNIVEVKEGDTLQTGAHTLRFLLAPMVHWPEVMFAFDETSGVLFSADAFGSYGALCGHITDEYTTFGALQDEMLRYYSNIVGKYGNPVQKALQKIASLDVRTIAPTHGHVLKRNINEAVALYDRVSRFEAEAGVVIIFGSMYGHTAQMADTIATALAREGVEKIVMHDVSRSHPSYILRDVFRYRCVIAGCPTYTGGIFPEMAAVLHKIENCDVRNRLFGCFGSFSWAGAAARKLEEFGDRMKWTLVAPPVEQRQGLSEICLNACSELAKAIKENA